MPERNRDGRYLSIGAPATFVDHVRPDGVMVRWESRRHRKHQKSAGGSTWWAPRARGCHDFDARASELENRTFSHVIANTTPECLSLEFPGPGARIRC